MEMTSNCDVTNSAHQIVMTTIWPWTKPLMKIFCVRHWLHVLPGSEQSYFSQQVRKIWNNSSIPRYCFWKGHSQIRAITTLRFSEVCEVYLKSTQRTLSCKTLKFIKVLKNTQKSLFKFFFICFVYPWPVADTDQAFGGSQIRGRQKSSPV